jgi:hypothetical protein
MSKSILVNGIKFVERGKLVATLFDPCGTADIEYQPVENGINLYGINGKLFAFLAVRGPNKWLVSAKKDGNKIRYFNALSSIDEQRMNITGYRNAIETAENIFSAIYATQE